MVIFFLLPFLWNESGDEGVHLMWEGDTLLEFARAFIINAQ